MSYYDDNNSASGFRATNGKDSKGLFNRIYSEMPPWPALYLYAFSTLLLCIFINLAFDIRYFISLLSVSGANRTDYINFYVTFIFEIVYAISIVVLLTKKNKWAFVIALTFTFCNLLLTLLFLYSGSTIFDFIAPLFVTILATASQSSLGTALFRIIGVFTENRESSLMLTLLSTVHNNNNNLSGFLIETVQLYLTTVVILLAWLRGNALDSYKSKSWKMVFSAAAIIGLVILISYVVNQTATSTSHSSAPTNSESQSTHDGNNRIQ